MKRELWALAEAWITVWREVGGARSGDALLEAKYIRNVSLSERPNIIRKQQPGSSWDSIVVNGVQTTFQISKGYLSMAETAAIANPEYQYQIDVYMINPKYDGIEQSDDLRILQTCTLTTSGFTGKDNDVFEEEVAYDVSQISLYGC